MRKPFPTPEVVACLPPDGGPSFNRLVFERSQHLRYHAQNPIQWYPWGDEALARAQEEQKPIFLVVGFSTCHWCHEMRRGSFENADVAHLLNTRYVPIKVDREERPDIDRLFMPARQVLRGSTGWPNCVWLTPEGTPFYAGGYLPADSTESDSTENDGKQRAGLIALLTRLADFWENDRAAAQEQATRITEAVETHLAGSLFAKGTPHVSLFTEWLQQLDTRLNRTRGTLRETGPMFPPIASLRLLLTQAKREFAAQDQTAGSENHETEKRGDSAADRAETGGVNDTEKGTVEELRHAKEPSVGGRAWEMLCVLLDAMALGGLYDHVGGGFHRYSMDETWFVPRFEKMLSDNAQLAEIYAEAFRLGKLPHHARIARSTVGWMMRELRHPDDAYWSSLGAAETRETPAFYVWQKQEIMATLGTTDGTLLCDLYGVMEDGNWTDPWTGEAQGTNILHLKQTLEDEAVKCQQDTEAFVTRVEEMTRRLLEARKARPPLTPDEKVVCSWNGLAISALAKVGFALEEEGLIEAARLTATFVTKRLIDADKLYSIFAEDTVYTDAMLDDYAFLAQGMLDLYDVTRATRWLEAARRITNWMIDRFHAEDSGFYLTAQVQGGMWTRPCDPMDRMTPSGNGIAAAVLLRLARHENDKTYARIAQSTIHRFGGILATHPRQTESLLAAFSLLLELDKERTAAEQLTFPRGDVQETADSIHLSAYLSSRSGPPSQTLYVAFRIVIEAGSSLPALEGSWHSTQSDVDPTRLTLSDESPFQVEIIEFSPPVERAIDERMAMVYVDSFWLCIGLNAKPDTRGGRYKLPFELRFKAHDGEGWRDETMLSFNLPFVLDRGASEGMNRHPDIFDRFLGIQEETSAGR